MPINEASIKTQKDGVGRDSGLVSTWRFGESGVPGEGMEAPHPFPVPCSMRLLHLGVPELYPSIISQQSSK